VSSYERGSRLEELVDLTKELTEEFPEFPAGSVMRCVARVVWHERRLGTREDQLADRSAAEARRLLTERRTGAGHPAVRHVHAGHHARAHAALSA
jgi:hypothetical protein